MTVYVNGCGYPIPHHPHVFDVIIGPTTIHTVSCPGALKPAHGPQPGETP